MSHPHMPVLLQEVLEQFQHLDEGIIVDCTLGYAGHSTALLEQHKQIKLIGIDQDETAINYSTQQLAPFSARVRIEKGAFSKKCSEILATNEPVVVLLADIGVSSLQLDNRERGFSFHGEALDMRMNQEQSLTAKEVVNHYDKSELVQLLKTYGELHNADAIATEIIQKRPFQNAQELASLTSLRKRKGIHPATLLFQAIRIEVNDELGELNRLLDAIASKNRPLLVAIITFHSLEDRIVKQRFASWAKSCICPPEAMRCTCGNNHEKGKIITKKPLTASKQELKQNSRSRSAKLRVFDFRGTHE